MPVCKRGPVKFSRWLRRFGQPRRELWKSFRVLCVAFLKLGQPFWSFLQCCHGVSLLPFEHACPRWQPHLPPAPGVRHPRRFQSKSVTEFDLLLEVMPAAFFMMVPNPKLWILLVFLLGTPEQLQPFFILNAKLHLEVEVLFARFWPLWLAAKDVFLHVHRYLLTAAAAPACCRCPC